MGYHKIYPTFLKNKKTSLFLFTREMTEIKVFYYRIYRGTQKVASKKFCGPFLNTKIHHPSL